jgi:LysR family glycine cleavage system transcriptional activator
VSLSALRTFEAVVRRGGLTAAAEELGSTASAISHQLRALDRSFGQPLLKREGRRVVPTNVASLLAHDLGRAFSDIDLALERARSARPTLTVSTHASFAARWLIPRLHRFEAVAPGIDLRLSASTRLVDLARERTDCAIRLGPGSWPDVTAMFLMPHKEGPIVRAAIAHRTDLPRVMLDGRSDEWAGWPELTTSPAVRTVPTRELMVDAVLAGVGIGVIDTSVIESELARAEVVALAPARASYWSYYCVTPVGVRMRPELAAFLHWLVKEAGQEPSAARPGPHDP